MSALNYNTMSGRGWRRSRSPGCSATEASLRSSPGHPTIGKHRVPYRRRGVTLLEVLISIFVLAVGLLSVAALIPVAGFQVQRAQIDDRKATVGPSAARTARIIGMLRPDYWLYANLNRFCDPGTGILYGNTQNGIGTNAAIGGPQSMPCVAIDPCGIKRFPLASNPTIALFASNGGQLAMPRLTCIYALNAAADQVCMSQDDLVFSVAPDTPDAPPGGGFNSLNTKRAFQGNFSWLATFVPVYGDAVAPPDSQSGFPGVPLNRNAMIMSIVVFNQRPTAVAPATQLGGVNVSGERAASASFTLAGAPPPNSAIGIGAGELQLTAPSGVSTIDQAKIALAVNPGEWIMLGTMLSDPNAPGNTPQQQVRPYFRWYRVVTAGPVLQAGEADNQTGTFARDLTISGPDWNLLTVGLKDSKGNPQFFAFIYDGAVAVYERTIHLEGPSMWSN